MVSYRIGLSECEHERASDSQHARRRVFSWSLWACQEQNSGQFDFRFGAKVGPRPVTINGTAGAVLYMDGAIDHTLSVAIAGERIAAIYVVRNPEKLRHVPEAAGGKSLN
jgi:hypothetical protein